MGAVTVAHLWLLLAAAKVVRWSMDLDVFFLCFFLEMEAYPRPLHHDDACGPFIKNPESIIIKVLQLANGAKS